ncbi:hypothetical protein DMA11_06965 [Marinilabiliaceae bacterium JC017]|nr:hypothetical protein DMA11_06965 [Marinilabiliaceae bacterium JC017]
MNYSANPYDFLALQAQALLSRLRQVKPFALSMPMVNAATIPDEADVQIEKMITTGCKELEAGIQKYLRLLDTATSRKLSPYRAQFLFSSLKLRFNALQERIDIYADVYTQRGEHETGVLLKGLDNVAYDALSLDGKFTPPTPMLCYLERGLGAAIRRFSTRLPGKKKTPVTIIRVPRERMVGTAIASSLVHEVGHQGAALLNLVNIFKQAIRTHQTRLGSNSIAWRLFENWTSEILADTWAVAKLGITAPIGLIGVVSLPKYFVLKINMADPHPFPWIRVIISATIGKALYPHPQWDQLISHWKKFYPLKGVHKNTLQIIREVEQTLPAFINLLLNYKVSTLKGRSLRQVFPIKERHPAQLKRMLKQPAVMKQAAPTLLFAALGQGTYDKKISTSEASERITQHLEKWALDKKYHYS